MTAAVGPQQRPGTCAPTHTPTAGGTITVVIIGAIMSVLDVTAVNVALPRLAAAFRTPLATVQWTATGYTLALAAVIPTAAWAMHRFGAKRAYLTALLLFMGGSALAASSWSAGSLIAFRVVQGLGGGLLMPVGMAMVMRTAAPERRGRVMAMLGIPIVIGPVLGPVLGGWLVDAVSWHWIFLVNLPVGAAALALGAVLLRRDEPGGRGTAPLDVPGLLLLSPGLALLLFGLARGGSRGDFGEPAAWGPVAAGALLAAGFARRALTARHPLVDLRLFRDRQYRTGLATLSLFTCGYFGSMLLLPMYLQNVRGLGAAESGAVGAPMGLAVGVSMQISSRLVDRVSPRRLIASGIVLAAAGLALFTAGLTAGTPYWRLCAALVVSGAGVGMTTMPTMATATRRLDGPKVPSGSTLLNINQQVWTSVGTAMLTVLVSALSAGGTAADPAAFRTGYWCVVALQALALLPALRLPGRADGSASAR